MEQTCVNGGAVWDGPELIWTEDFQNLSDGFHHRRRFRVTCGCVVEVDHCCLLMLHHLEAHDLGNLVQHLGVVAEDKHLMMPESCQLVHEPTGIVHLDVIIW